MAKKRKEASSAPNGGKGEEEQPPPRNDDNGGADSSSDDSSSDDDSLVLEGAVMRNPDVSDSSDDDDDDDLSSEEEEGAGQAKKKAKTVDAKGGGKTQGTQQQQKKKKKKSPSGPETIQVEFLFCDVHERFFHGLKTLLHRHPIHASHSSQLADLVIANEMVATVLSSDIEPTAAAAAAGQKKQGNQSSKGAAALPPQEEANVFGFASIVNISANNASPTVQSLTAICLKHCPQQHKAEMETVLSGKTNRPAGFFFHERMVNVPLEITEVLHQQLVLDMDYAVEHADDEAERKSLDFGAFVRLAPCYKGEGGGNNSVMYKYFDDEVFATNAEFVYHFEAPKMYEGDEEDMLCCVIVITKTGHRKAMQELKKMIHVG